MCLTQNIDLLVPGRGLMIWRLPTSHCFQCQGADGDSELAFLDWHWRNRGSRGCLTSPEQFRLYVVTCLVRPGSLHVFAGCLD